VDYFLVYLEADLQGKGVKRGHVSCGLGLLEEGMIDVSCIFGFDGSNEVYL
jgi:hypothetical protein